MNSETNRNRLISLLDTNWTRDETIHLQLMRKLRYIILSDICIEGEEFIAIRDICTKCKISVTTVTKVFIEMAAGGIFTNARGNLNKVSIGAKQKIRAQELDKIYVKEVPSIVQRIELLGSNKQELITVLSDA